jgi:hypothetical protein
LCQVAVIGASYPAKLVDLHGFSPEETRARRPARPSAGRTEGGLWLVGFGAIAAAAGAALLPAAIAREADVDVAGRTLLSAGPGYWVLVGLAVLALLAVEAFLGWAGAWIAIVALGAAGVATAVAAATVLPPAGEPLAVVHGGVAGTAHARPGPALLALAVGGLAVAAGGLLLRPRS